MYFLVIAGLVLKSTYKTLMDCFCQEKVVLLYSFLGTTFWKVCCSWLWMVEDLGGCNPIFLVPYSLFWRVLGSCHPVSLCRCCPGPLSKKKQPCSASLWPMAYRDFIMYRSVWICKYHQIIYVQCIHRYAYTYIYTHSTILYIAWAYLLVLKS